MSIMEDGGEKLGVRFAEKTRKPCLSQQGLGDAVARATIEAYESHLKEDERCGLRQRVLASVVAVDSRGEVRVLSYGLGTKVAQLALIASDAQGLALRDCHAEVLARRGFLRYCYDGGEMKADERLVIYSSSMPCGNATIKRWAKTVRSSDPTGPHGAFHVFAEGQVDLLLKKHPDDTTHANGPAWLPSGCLPLHSTTTPTTTAKKMSASPSHCCSDKIARWVALGLQGSLLSGVSGPLRVSAIVVGRKFSYEHARRAFCCRIKGLPASDHPALLGTTVKLDDGLYRDPCQGAVFDDDVRAWWATLEGENPEVIDGRTGRLKRHGRPSRLCKRALADAWRALQTTTKDNETKPLEEKNDQVCLSYSDAKIRFASDAYRLKRLAFFNHPPFDAWLFAPREHFPFFLPLPEKTL